MDNFPDGSDYAWLAVDSVNHVAVFTNAGVGPIPIPILADRKHTDWAESKVLQLPEYCRSDLLVTLPCTDSFVAFARRGLFAFDWQDVHRTASFVRQYELIARPDEPATLDAMPPTIIELATIVRFASIRFSDSLTVNVLKLVECYPG